MAGEKDKQDKSTPLLTSIMRFGIKIMLCSLMVLGVLAMMSLSLLTVVTTELIILLCSAAAGTQITPFMVLVFLPPSLLVQYHLTEPIAAFLGGLFDFISAPLYKLLKEVDTLEDVLKQRQTNDDLMRSIHAPNFTVASNELSVISKASEEIDNIIHKSNKSDNMIIWGFRNSSDSTLRTEENDALPREAKVKYSI